MKKRLTEAWKKSSHFYQKEIWQHSPVPDRRVRKASIGALRVISTTWTVFLETRTPSRAAALSFSSLLGIAPCIALAVLIAGVVLGQRDPGTAVNKLNQLFRYLAPQLAAYESIKTTPDVQPGQAVDPAAPAAGTTTTTENEMLAMMNGFITSAKSGSAGVVAALSLVLVVLLLFKSIEDAFNEIWGVRKGRSWLTRIIFYWSIFTLGAVLFIASITGLNVSSIFKAIPLSDKFSGLQSFLVTLGPLVAMAVLVALLSLFYRTIPNTKVLWRAAFIGGLVATALLRLNSVVSFLYVQRVVLQRSLYGSVALPLILLSSLYIFWLYILIGGIISYAVQNVHFRNSQAAWSRLNESQRERLSLLVLLTICRRFQACLPPVSSLQLSTMTKVPTQILNECLTRLVEMKLVAPLHAADAGTSTSSDMIYQPARPLNRITLFEFKTLDDNLGESPMGETLERLDPLMHAYSTGLNQLGKQELFQKSLEELLAEHPFDETTPPFQRIPG